jgi:hypothetical protein
MGRDSSVGIATRQGLDCMGIESWHGGDFPHQSRPALWSTQPRIQWVPGLSRVVKRPGHGVDHQPPSSTEFRERIALYLYPPSGLSWPVLSGGRLLRPQSEDAPYLGSMTTDPQNPLHIASHFIHTSPFRSCVTLYAFHSSCTLNTR